MKIIYFDLETTGLDSKTHSIHQLSGLVEIDGKAVEHFNYNVQPASGKLVDSEALEVSGKTFEDLFSYEKSPSVFGKFVEILGKYVDKFNKTDKYFLVGYNNSSFDNQFLREWFIDHAENENAKRYGNYFGSWFWANPIDVYCLSSFFTMKKRHIMIDGKLGTMAKAFGNQVDDSNLHDGLYDVGLTMAIFKRIRNIANAPFICSGIVNEILTRMDNLSDDDRISDDVKAEILDISQEIRTQLFTMLEWQKF